MYKLIDSHGKINSVIYELGEMLDINYLRFLSLLLITISVIADADAASCSKGLLQKVSDVTLKSEHFSWYKTERKSSFSKKNIKIIEAQIYNASDAYKLGFFRLNITLGNGTKIPLSPSASNVQIGPLKTATIRFNAPKSVFSKGTTAGLKAQLFSCQEVNFELVTPPKVILGEPIKPSNQKTFSYEEIQQQKADKIRQDEIYDNCIIDLMPDTTNTTKIISIMDKCKRVSKNPSWLDELKY